MAMGMRTASFLLAPAIIGFVTLPGAAATGDADPAAVVAHDVPLTPMLQKRTLDYWTPRRMLDALSAVKPRSRSGAQPQAAGAQGGALWTAGGAVRRTTGKVFFTLNGRDYLCSASTVQSANRDLVVTAGHCAKDGTGDWTENWIFVPGYQSGRSPYGGFTARRMFVPDQWSGSADGDYDLAMVALSPADGRHVQDSVGAQRIAFGTARGAQTYAFGYPSTGRYDGERLAYCSGRPRTDPRDATTGQGLRCDMTQGSSGGPWLADFDGATGTGVITSVSSFKYADDETTMYGPYFGTAAHRLYDRAQHG